MKATLKVSENLTIEVEGETEAEVFEGIAKAQETFQHESCGCCKTQNVRFIVRVDEEEHSYYELHCANLKCRARLVFGQNRKPKGSLFPKRRWASLSDSEKQKRGPEPINGYLPANGWFVWTPNK